MKSDFIKKILLLFLIAVFTMGECSMAQQCVITKSANLSRHGDVLVKQLVTNITAGDRGESSIWDFSGATIIDGNYKVKYDIVGDSTIRITEKGTRFDYKISTDTLFWLGFENRLSIIQDSIAAIALKYPFSYGDSIEAPFVQYGKYSKTVNVCLEGFSKVVCDAKGILILPDGDTIANVLRIHQTIDCAMKIDGRFNGNNCETNLLPRQTENRYYWYADGYRYPIVEIRNHKYSAYGKPVVSSQIALICSPKEQLFLQEDVENKEKRYLATLLNSDGDGNEYDTTGKDFDGNEIEVTLHKSQSTVSIDLIATAAMSVGGTLTDLHGRVFGYMPNRFVAVGEAYNASFNTSGLMPGEYLIHLYLGNTKQIKKFSVL